MTRNERTEALKVIIADSDQVQFLTNGSSVSDTAIAWAEANLSPGLCAEYMNARVWSASAAFLLHNAGVTPEQASRDYQGDSIGYWVSNGHLSVERAFDLVNSYEEALG